MRRRLFLTALGAGTASAFAGCSALETSESDDEDNDDNEMSMEEELLERAREEVVEDGQFAYTPNLVLLDIEDISTDTLTVELNVSYNPVSDYDINVHITPISAKTTVTGNSSFLRVNRTDDLQNTMKRQRNGLAMLQPPVLNTS